MYIWFLGNWVPDGQLRHITIYTCIYHASPIVQLTTWVKILLLPRSLKMQRYCPSLQPHIPVLLSIFYCWQGMMKTASSYINEVFFCYILVRNASECVSTLHNNGIERVPHHLLLNSSCWTFVIRSPRISFNTKCEWDQSARQVSTKHMWSEMATNSYLCK